MPRNTNVAVAEETTIQMALDILPKTAAVGTTKKLKVANEFINAQFRLDLLEFRAYLAITSSYNTKEKPESFYFLTFKGSELAKNIGIGVERGYFHELEKILTNLSQRIIKIQIRNDEDEEKEKWIKGHFVSSIEAKGDGQVEVVMDPKLMKYFFNIQNQYTFLEIQTLLSFTSIYAIRIYNLLKQFPNSSKRVFKLDELREMLMLQNKYANFTDFKRYVLDIAVQNINDVSTMQVKYTTNARKGVKATHVTFYYKEINLIDSPETDEKIKNILANLIGNNIDRKVALDILKKYKPDRIERNVNYILSTYGKKKNKKDIASLIIAAIKNDYIVCHDTEKDNEDEKKEENNKISEYINKLSSEEKNNIVAEINKEHDDKGVIARIIKNKSFDELYSMAAAKGIVLEKVQSLMNK